MKIQKKWGGGSGGCRGEGFGSGVGVDVKN